VYVLTKTGTRLMWLNYNVVMAFVMSSCLYFKHNTILPSLLLNCLNSFDRYCFFEVWKPETNGFT